MFPMISCEHFWLLDRTAESTLESLAVSTKQDVDGEIWHVIHAQEASLT